MTKAEINEICRKLVDQGKLIEAGFEGLRLLSIPANAPAMQVREMRLAFFAGAQHVFASILGILEPGSEPTENDLTRMVLINAELNQFIEQMKAQSKPVNARPN
jgi:hypothetical protein